MLLSATSRVDHVTSDAVTTAFAVPYKFILLEDLVVEVGADILNLEAQALGRDYEVSGAGDDAGGAVTFPEPITEGWTVRISRTVHAFADTEFRTQGPFPPAAHTGAHDKAMMVLQGVKRTLDEIHAGPAGAAGYAAGGGVGGNNADSALTSVLTDRGGDIFGGGGSAPLENGWIVETFPDFLTPATGVQVGSDGAYMQHLEGRARDGSDTLIATIGNASHKPAGLVRFPAVDNGVFGYVEVNTDGDVDAIGSSVAFDVAGIYRPAV